MKRTLRVLSVVGLFFLGASCTFAIKTEEDLKEKFPEAIIYDEKDRFSVDFDACDWGRRPDGPSLARESLTSLPLQQLIEGNYYTWWCGNTRKPISVVGSTSYYYIALFPGFSYLFAEQGAVQSRIQAKQEVSKACDKPLLGPGEFEQSRHSPKDFIGRCFAVTLYVRAVRMNSETEGLFVDDRNSSQAIVLKFSKPFDGRRPLFGGNLVVKNAGPSVYQHNLTRELVQSYEVIQGGRQP